MKNIFTIIDYKLLPFLAFPANIALFVMMMITMTDIVGRSLFNAPIMGSIEVTQIALAIMIVCAFPLVIRDEAHISVDLLDAWVPRWLVPWRQLCIHLMAVVALSLLTWQIYKYADRAFRYGDVTEFLRVPRGYILSTMTLMGGVSVVSSLARVIHYVFVIAGWQPLEAKHDNEHLKEMPHD